MIRNIYADHDADLVVRVPAGEFLAQQTVDLPDRAMVIANTGIGKTTCATGLPGQILFVTSTTPAVEQILQRIPDAHAWYQHRKDATPDSRLIVTTYNSFDKVLRFIDASRFYLVVDEIHNFVRSTSSTYRLKEMRHVADTLAGGWRGVLLMTGTPLPWRHPNLVDFQVVSVESEIREQKAQRVVWKSDENRRGRREDALVSLVNPDEKTLVYFNDKTIKLDRLVERLVRERGLQREQIQVLNADNKSERDSQALIYDERVADGVRVLITTDVMTEAVNLRSHFDAAHLVSATTPEMAQQFVNRLRISPAGNVYWYNVGAGPWHGVNYDTLLNDSYAEAELELAHLRQRIAVASASDDATATWLLERKIKQYRTQGLVRIERDEDGELLLDVDHLAVAHDAYQKYASFCNENPSAFKAGAQRYGWTWSDDLVLVATAPSAAAREEMTAVVDELRQERLQRHLSRVETVRDAGPRGARQMAGESATDGDMLRTLEQVTDVTEALLEATDQTDVDLYDAHALACDLVLEAEDSRRKVNTKVRQIRTQVDRLLARDPFVANIYSTTGAGDVFTSDDIHQRLVDDYLEDADMRFYAQRRLRLPWSSEPTSRLSKNKATQLFRELFETERVKIPGEMGRRDAWRVVSDQPLPDAVAEFLSKRLKPQFCDTPDRVRIIDADSAEPSAVRQLGPEDALVLVV